MRALNVSLLSTEQVVEKSSRVVVDLKRYDWHSCDIVIMIYVLKSVISWPLIGVSFVQRTQLSSLYVEKSVNLKYYACR